MLVEQTHLFYKAGSSDKIYVVKLEQAADDQFLVNFEYGRRGSALKAGSKTQTPVSEDKARSLYTKLVNEKTAKGYTPAESGIAYTATDHAERVTGISCQLLTAITDDDALKALIKDDAWVAEEKIDGERRLLHKTGASVIGINRRGLSVTILPDALIAAMKALPFHEVLMDGEQLGERLIAFDLLRLGKTENDDADMTALSVAERTDQLQHLDFGGDAVVISPVARTAAEKRALVERVSAAQGEGLVFKKAADSPYTGGRPASGGDWMKYKFYETASVRVEGHSDAKRSVQLSANDADGQSVAIGNCTVPVNQAMPAVGAIVEVRYLYYNHGGSLYQPTLLGERTDLTLDDCVLSQLKHKPVEPLPA